MIYKKIYPVFSKNGVCSFNLWSPKAKGIKLVLEGEKKEIPLDKNEGGYWHLDYPDVKPGDLYKYRINDGESFPDPGSLSQPQGVHGPSRLIDLKDFEWTDDNWKNIPLGSMIQYELHTGTFSPEGNFEGIISRLDYLNKLGVNTIELLPLARFSGKRNWGYDGVYPFAVHDAYGGAGSLMKLVNECHQRNIAVILDVVYNHFGPEGNYTSQYGYYSSRRYSTPWGEPINFDGPYSDGVRNYFVQNALMWCRDFHIDGLRLDAVHAIYDFSARHIMQELAENIGELNVQTKKKHYLIAESNLNDVRYISPVDKGGYSLDAQWSDDFHHSVHTLVTKEKKGYYIDFGKPEQLSKSIKESFDYDGKYSVFRKKTYGSSTKNNSAEQFVIFTQNHDQVGNRKFGERIINLAGFEVAKLIAGTLIVSPNIPMLFMGEEYGEENPFFYFVSHKDSYLNELVRKGRSEEFKDFNLEDEREAPDPSSPETFNRSKLSWGIEEDSRKKSMFNYYRDLIHIRKQIPAIRTPNKENISISEDNKLFTLQRWLNKSKILCFLNYSEDDREVKIDQDVNEEMELTLYSTDKKYSGPGEPVPPSVNAGDKISVKKYSFILFSN